MHQRPTLALCVALVDVNVPPQDSDRQLLDFLSASGRDFLLVATKSDRLSNNQLHNALRTLTQEYPAARPLPSRPRPAPDATNSGSRSGKPRIRRHWLKRTPTQRSV